MGAMVNRWSKGLIPLNFPCLGRSDNLLDRLRNLASARSQPPRKCKGGAYAAQPLAPGMDRCLDSIKLASPLLLENALEEAGGLLGRARTLYDKIVDSHVVQALDDAGVQVLLYIDRSVLNEYTSPQAFSGLREAGRSVWRPSAALGVVDHVNSTAPARTKTMSDAGGQRQT